MGHLIALNNVLSTSGYARSSLYVQRLLLDPRKTILNKRGSLALQCFNVKLISNSRGVMGKGTCKNLLLLSTAEVGYYKLYYCQCTGKG